MPWIIDPRRSEAGSGILRCWTRSGTSHSSSYAWMAHSLGYQYAAVVLTSEAHKGRADATVGIQDDFSMPGTAADFGAKFAGEYARHDITASMRAEG
jgi:hypothetical protein